ncbi:hypothetical protein [Methanobrevibacter sp. DSM 116169]|uniref:hypothetical protein n=1 Tax=Methanobrevibacter sp. DSM 116169 TaxID=3242727 RepID=UPI0038FC0101
MTSSIEIHPEYEKLSLELDEMKDKLTKKILEEHELYFHICKNIEADYMIRLGYIEYNIFEREVEIKMLQREIALIQKAINQDAEVDTKAIKKKIAMEYDDYLFELDKKASEFGALIRYSKNDQLSDDENEKLKNMYKKLILKFHPDLNNNLTDEEKELFFKILHAYEAGDINILNLIFELHYDNLSEDIVEDSIEALKERIKLLKIRIDVIQGSIDRIKLKYPYIKKDILEDDDLLLKTKRELEDQLFEKNEIFDEYVDKLLELKGDYL